MDKLYAVLGFFQSGGLFMYPIAFILALGVAIAIERYIYLSVAENRNRKVWKQVVPLVEQGHVERAWELVLGSNSVMSQVLGYGLQCAQSPSSKDAVQRAMEEGALEFLPRLEKRTHYLATFANVATLLGLLGTIMGLTEAFSTLSDVGSGDRAQVLSASISLAMNTTAFGLMVAIPMLLVHAYMQTKVTQVLDGLQMASIKLPKMLDVELKSLDISHDS
ncbi:MAG: MotA/TolQ/ExbB proton channel family protein [Motiliproteus sp.]